MTAEEMVRKSKEAEEKLGYWLYVGKVCLKYFYYISAWLLLAYVAFRVW